MLMINPVFLNNNLVSWKNDVLCLLWESKEARSQLREPPKDKTKNKYVVESFIYCLKIFKCFFIVSVPLKITKPPHLLTVSKGNAATFYCESVGTRPLITEWRKDGYLLKRSNRISITTNALTILDVTTSDEGVYQCVVRSRFDEKQATARLIVDGR